MGAVRALCAVYLLAQDLERLWSVRRDDPVAPLRQCWPWLIATFGATLVNPWGWEIYGALLRQEGAMAAQLQWIPEWGSVPLNWTMLTNLSLRAPGGSFYLMLLIAAATGLVAVLRKQLGAAIFLGTAATLAVEHIRFEALFGIVRVIVGADVLRSDLTELRGIVENARLETAR